MTGSVSKRERIIWISLATVIVAISVLVVVKYQATLTLAKQKAADLEGEKAAWMQQEVNPVYPLNNPDIINGLKQQGFNGSIQDIIDDLVKHPELIPYAGVLGGKMGFYSPENICVLSDKWVYAGFDDGHINGYMLLAYSITNGTISWEVIDSYLFGQ